MKPLTESGGGLNWGRSTYSVLVLVSVHAATKTRASVPRRAAKDREPIVRDVIGMTLE
jgi:hypothetical protein